MIPTTASFPPKQQIQNHLAKISLENDASISLTETDIQTIIDTVSIYFENRSIVVYQLANEINSSLNTNQKFSTLSDEQKQQVTSAIATYLITLLANAPLKNYII
jgi:hypothetical protein